MLTMNDKVWEKIHFYIRVTYQTIIISTVFFLTFFILNRSPSLASLASTSASSEYSMKTSSKSLPLILPIFWSVFSASPCLPLPSSHGMDSGINLKNQSEDDVTSYLSTRFVPVSTQGWNYENCSHRWKIDPVRKVRGQQRNQDWCWWVAHHQTHKRNGSIGDTTILNHCQHSWWSRSRYWRLTNKIWKMRNCVVTTANEESFKSKTFQKMDKLQEFQIFLLIWLTDLPQDWD